jgi:hypothetical protein
VTLQSQAQRSMVLAEIGTPRSVSPAGAPGRPSSVSTEAVTCRLTVCFAHTSSTSASAMRCSAWRVSSAPFGRASGSSALRNAAPPTGSRKPSMLATPFGQVLSLSLRCSAISACSCAKRAGSLACR